MTDKHDKLLKRAKEATDNLFKDTSVTQEETRESLIDLRVYIEEMIDALPKPEDQ